MSEFIKCDGCGRMAKKDLINGPKGWSTVEITTHRNNSIFGEDVSKYHVCPECYKNLLEVLPFSEIETCWSKEAMI